MVAVRLKPAIMIVDLRDGESNSGLRISLSAMLYFFSKRSSKAGKFVSFQWTAFVVLLQEPFTETISPQNLSIQYRQCCDSTGFSKPKLCCNLWRQKITIGNFFLKHCSCSAVSVNVTTGQGQYGVRCNFTMGQQTLRKHGILIPDFS